MRATRAFLALVAMVALSGCETVPKRVLVPVPVSCKVDMPKPPVWATDALASDAQIWDQVKALLAERKQRIGFQIELEAALRACQSPAQPAALDK